MTEYQMLIIVIVAASGATGFLAGALFAMHYYRRGK